MSLLDIKHYMSKVRMASLASLCTVFKTEPDSLRCLLEHWVKKGKIRQCMKKPACGSKCFRCPTTDIELYEWVDAAGGLAIL